MQEMGSFFVGAFNVILDDDERQRQPQQPQQQQRRQTAQLQRQEYWEPQQRYTQQQRYQPARKEQPQQPPRKQQQSRQSQRSQTLQQPQPQPWQEYWEPHQQQQRYQPARRTPKQSQIAKRHTTWRKILAFEASWESCDLCDGDHVVYECEEWTEFRLKQEKRIEIMQGCCCDTCHLPLVIAAGSILDFNSLKEVPILEATLEATLVNDDNDNNPGKPINMTHDVPTKDLPEATLAGDDLALTDDNTSNSERLSYDHLVLDLPDNMSISIGSDIDIDIKVPEEPEEPQGAALMDLPDEMSIGMSIGIDIKVHEDKDPEVARIAEPSPLSSPDLQEVAILIDPSEPSHQEDTKTADLKGVVHLINPPGIEPLPVPLLDIAPISQPSKAETSHREGSVAELSNLDAAFLVDLPGVTPIYAMKDDSLEESLQEMRQPWKNTEIDEPGLKELSHQDRGIIKPLHQDVEPPDEVVNLDLGTDLGIAGHNIAKLGIGMNIKSDQDGTHLINPPGAMDTEAANLNDIEVASLKNAVNIESLSEKLRNAAHLINPPGAKNIELSLPRKEPLENSDIGPGFYEPIKKQVAMSMVPQLSTMHGDLWNTHLINPPGRMLDKHLNIEPSRHDERVIEPSLREQGVEVASMTARKSAPLLLPLPSRLARMNTKSLPVKLRNVVPGPSNPAELFYRIGAYFACAANMAEKFATTISQEPANRTCKKIGHIEPHPALGTKKPEKSVVAEILKDPDKERREMGKRQTKGG